MTESLITLKRNTRKKDIDLQRGLIRSGRVYGVRFTCAAGHVHEERVGPLKSEAIRVYHERRARAYAEPGWCPAEERRLARAAAKARKAGEARRISFRQYADESYLPWAESHQRSYRTTRAELGWLVKRLGERKLEEITSADVERVLAGLQN